ncbi:MAG: heme anaerobic degradation radical SAM methyltransferase ChuW/HutW, partial [Bilophila wadsworthia]
RTSRERNLYNLYVKGRAHCLAFGPGAGGNLDGFFYLNQSDYRAWQEEVRAGRKPIAMLFRPFPQGKLFKAIAEGMEQGWLDMPGLEAAYGIPLGEVWKPVLEQWERAGLVERDGAFIVLTLAGQFWQVNLSQLLLDYLKRALEA